MSEVFLASRNPKKLDELRRILGEQLPGVRVLGLDDVTAYDEPVEDAPDFAGNALLKARAGLRATGVPSLADDSGLCVDALNDMPGVLSARWAGRTKDDAANNALVLDQLHDVPESRRGAQFRCAVALCLPEGTSGAGPEDLETVVEGVMRGRVIRESRGSGGFGYDVIFVPEEQEGLLTSAEMDPASKDAISHRGRALRAMVPHLLTALG